MQVVAPNKGDINASVGNRQFTKSGKLFVKTSTKPHVRMLNDENLNTNFLVFSLRAFIKPFHAVYKC